MQHHSTSLRGRQTADSVYLKTLRRADGEWMTAQAVAARHGHSRHSVAHALKRLVERQKVEYRVIEVPGKGRVREETRIYRARATLGSLLKVERLLPAWLAPQVVAECGEARQVAGRAGLVLQEDGMPGGPENGAAKTPITSGPSPSVPFDWTLRWLSLRSVG